MSTQAQVPDAILTWLHRNLAANYRNVDRTYSDVARTLAGYPSLEVRTAIYTYDNGSTALLILLHGKLPVAFQGTVYKFPVSIWVPYAYPLEPPSIFFIPNQSLVIRPGQHVSVEGRVYHPYLAQWSNHWTRSTLLDCLAVLQDALAKEPPLVARAPPTRDTSGSRKPSENHSVNLRSHYFDRASPSLPSAQPPPPPPKPPEARPSSIIAEPTNGQLASLPHPPPRPPKSGYADSAPIPIRAHPYHTSPPAPPWPPANPHSASYATNTTQSTSRTPQLPDGRSTSTLSYPPRLSASSGDSGSNQTQMFQPMAYSTIDPSVQQNLNVSLQKWPHATSGATSSHRQPVQDLLSMPFEMSLPSQTLNTNVLAAPPIPPNPEKDALLQAISGTLRAQIEEAIKQEYNALPALEAQQHALRQAMHNMKVESRQLDELNQLLSQNGTILHDAVLDADRLVEGAKQRELPKVDDVLVAPTVVGEQLYKLIADEQSIGDALFALTKALDRGRISGDVLIKQTRSLAREQFLQKALIKKIARGMGLNHTS